MSYQTLSYQKKDHVIVINLLGPANDQVKVARLSQELSDLSAEINSDETVRVAILTAGDTPGSPFSIGIDLNGEILKAEKESETQLWSIAEPIAKLDCPVIAAITGDAIGQGLELALACDIRIADEASRFGLPHIKRGIIPWDGGTQRLLHLLGKAKAIEMILCGEVIDAQEACRIGLVSKVVSPEELSSVVMDIAEEMASKGPLALRYAKEAINKGMDLSLEQGLRLEADLYFLLHTTSDRTEGITAFQEKRPPLFEGK